MLEMTCPHCNRSVELDDDRRGRPARCPMCGGAFRAPLADNEPAVGARPKGGTVADVAVIVAAVVAVAGTLLTAAGILVRTTGGTLPVSRTVLMVCLALPFAVIVVSWLVVLPCCAGAKAENMLAVLVARFAGYLWLLGLAVLILKMVPA